jgi:hypothetical protein
MLFAIELTEVLVMDDLSLAGHERHHTSDFPLVDCAFHGGRKALKPRARHAHRLRCRNRKALRERRSRDDNADDERGESVTD